MPKIIPLRVVNPRTKKKFSKRRRPPVRSKRRNPLAGGGELVLMTNPKRKKKVNAQRRRSNPFASKKRVSRRRSNPFVSRRRTHRRSNPSIGGMDVGSLLKIGASAAVGGVATRSVTQMLLSSNNTGWMGYAANVVASFGLGYLADKFVGKDIGVGVAAGGIAATAMRIWQDKVSLTSPSQLSGLGDMDFSSDGMGEYVESYIPVPTVSTKTNGQYITNFNPYPAPAPALPAASAGPSKGKGMGATVTRRLSSRFA